MSYTSINFKTKSALKTAIKNGEKITVFNPNNLTPTPQNGIVYLEGPHYPQPHKWYAQATIVDGYVTKVT